MKTLQKYLATEKEYHANFESSTQTLQFFKTGYPSNDNIAVLCKNKSNACGIFNITSLTCM